MKPFQPSIAFLRYYETVMAEVNGPIYPGMAPLVVTPPDLRDIRERTFVALKMLPLIEKLNAYRASVPAPGASPSPAQPNYTDYLNSVSAP